MASTVVTRKSPAPGRAVRSEDAAPMSHAPASPAREGPASISRSATASMAVRRKAGDAAYQSPSRSRKPFQTAGNAATASGRRSDHCPSSSARGTSTAAAPPPKTSSAAVVTRAAAKDRRTRSSRRTRPTAGSTMALSPRASRNGSRGTISHRRNKKLPASHSRTAAVLCNVTLNCDISINCTSSPQKRGEIL